MPINPDESPEASKVSGRAQQSPPSDPSPGLPSKRQVVHAVIFNLTMLAELTLAVYIANRYQERFDITLTFIAVFFGLLIPTIFVSRVVMRSAGTTNR